MWKKSISHCVKNNKLLKVKGGYFLKNYNLSLSDLDDSTILRENESLLSLLLKDHTTGKNIRWGTDNYINHGYSFRYDQEIKVDLITGWYDGVIRPRADKDIDVQLERQRNRAEVFTPSWVIKMQVEAALEDMEELSLLDFIQTKWLEITCGEAPYMVNRYDMNTGEIIPLNKRTGFIDVKFRKINEKIDSENKWVKLALVIYKTSYGYEYQGDSLLLARENLILTFVDNYFYMFGAFPDDKLLLKIAKIVSLNVIQMDGLTYEVPYSNGGTAEEFGTQLSLFDDIEIEEVVEAPKLAGLKLWDKDELIEFKALSERNDSTMKFDVVIGNPPYQIENKNRKRDDAIYPVFMDTAYAIGEKVILITPGRFLFNVGSTPKKWNEKMLKDKHLEVLYYANKSDEIFPNTDITGGIAITYRDEKELLGPINVFTPYYELSTIVEKVDKIINTQSKKFGDVMHVQNKFDLDSLYSDYPEFKERLGSNGRERRLTSSIFSLLPELFHSKSETENYIGIFGRYNNKRVYKYIDSKYIEDNGNLEGWKVFVPAANGSGALGEVSSTPVIGEPEIGEPYIGHTQTFISIGSFATQHEGESCLKYIKSKFARAMLGVLKVTQNNKTKETWSKVPVQDFTKNSDIDWSQSIPEIDQQLYKKYDLNQEEINFIETHVKEME